MNKLLIIAGIFGFLLAGWSCHRDSGKLHIYTGYTQGTTFRIMAGGNNDTLQIRRSVDSVLLHINKVFSVYDSGSVISAVNRDDSVTVTPLFELVFNRSMQISEITGGAFDCTVAPLVKAWGFWKKKGTLPDSLEIARLLPLVGFSKITLRDGRIVKQIPGMMLDFNAIAQGFTVDEVFRTLEVLGCTSIMVEIGGEVRASSGKPDGRPWVIGIEQPAASDTSPQIIERKAELRNIAIATSGNYRKFYIRDGIRYSHTIDPSTGYPVNHSLLSVTVTHRDCMTADALATAFMVMGMEKSLELLAGYPEAQALFITAGSDGGYHFHSTPGFEALTGD